MTTTMETRQVSGFDWIVLRDMGDLTITQGETEALRIEAEADLLPKIATEVRDGQLVLELGRGWWERLTTTVLHPARHVKYDLTLKQIHGLAIEGFAHVQAGAITTDVLELETKGHSQVKIDKLQAHRLEVGIKGRGELELGGKVDEQEVEINGSGDYRAGRLASAITEVSIGGHGHAVVWADKELHVYVSGLGTVEYYGAPKVMEEVSGLSTVKSLGAPPGM